MADINESWSPPVLCILPYDIDTEHEKGKWCVVVRNPKWDNGIPVIMPSDSKKEAEEYLAFHLKYPTIDNTYTCEFKSFEEIHKSDVEVAKYPAIKITAKVEFKDGSTKYTSTTV